MQAARLKDLNQFDRKRWRQWSRTLPRRASRVRPGSAVYLHLALEKWTAAYELHKRAMRTRSQVALHELRIGIKRFRYTVENFLPQQHALWGDDLKELQDLLGEVHDLDVLWATALGGAAFPDMESRKRWREKLNHERAKRIERYREKMIGRQSLWRVWRAELPSGPQLRAAALSRLRLGLVIWIPILRIRSEWRNWRFFCMRIEECLGLLDQSDSDATARITRLAHSVAGSGAYARCGQSEGCGNHQKKSYRMIRGLARPLGWSARELELAAVVARYHRGALPHPRGKIMQCWSCRIGRLRWSWLACCAWPTRWTFIITITMSAAGPNEKTRTKEEPKKLRGSK